MPTLERCPGSGRRVYGPDEPGGTVLCSECGRSFLRMETVIEGEKKVFRVAEHQRPVRLRTRRTGHPSSGRDRARSSGRR